MDLDEVEMNTPLIIYLIGMTLGAIIGANWQLRRFYHGYIPQKDEIQLV